MKPLFLGIDCSSKTIHVVILSKKGEVKNMVKFESKSADFETRFLETHFEFDKWASENVEPPSIAVIENPIYIQNIKVTNALNHVIAGAKIALHRYAVQYFAVDNRHWKKYVVGSGNASKEQIMQFAKTKWPNANFKEQDYADAACIAFWGVQRFGKE